MRKNINNWKVLNNTFPMFAAFCFFGILFLGCRVSYWYFLFMGFIPILFWKKEFNIYQILLLMFLFLCFAMLILFAWQYGLVKLYKQNAVGYVRQAAFGFFDKHYSSEIASFIKLILFNVKTKETYVFYKQTVDLGIVWLLCISGFHISLLSRITTWLFKKKPIIGRYVNISIILFYSYLLNFSFASLRVFLKNCFEPLFQRLKISKFDRIGFIGLIISLLNPYSFTDYGFLFSFLICIGANCVSLLDLNSKIINKILVNVLAFVITIPFVLQMNHKISLFTFVNAFVFNFFSPFIFLYFLFFAWMPFMNIVHHGIIVSVYAIIGNISYSNIFIYSNTWQKYVIAVYYILLYVVIKIIYLIVYNNKI